jgi:hypothetical protein
MRRRIIAIATMLLLIQAGLIATSISARAAVPPTGPAIFHNNQWYLRTTPTSGAATSTFAYGRVGDIPVMGDWNGDGTDTVGVVRTTPGPSGTEVYTWHLRDTNSSGGASITPFVFGTKRFVAVDQLGSIPVVGDWNGDGIDTIGVVQYSSDPNGPIRWELRNTNTAGAPDIVLIYSRGRDRPVVGDWNGDGTDTIGVVRQATSSWLLRNSNTGGIAQINFVFGSSRFHELPVVGDWNGDGIDTPAVLRNVPVTDVQGGYERWLFRNSNSSGTADGTFTYGNDALGLDPPIEFIPRLAWRP